MFASPCTRTRVATPVTPRGLTRWALPCSQQVASGYRVGPCSPQVAGSFDTYRLRTFWRSHPLWNGPFYTSYAKHIRSGDPSRCRTDRSTSPHHVLTLRGRTHSINDAREEHRPVGHVMAPSSGPCAEGNLVAIFSESVNARNPHMMIYFWRNAGGGHHRRKCDKPRN